MNVWTKIPALKKLKANSNTRMCMHTRARVCARTHTLSAKENENYPIREEYPI